MSDNFKEHNYYIFKLVRKQQLVANCICYACKNIRYLFSETKVHNILYSNIYSYILLAVWTITNHLSKKAYTNTISIIHVNDHAAIIKMIAI